MTVTCIEPFYKGKGRVAIYLNNEFAFVLYKGELLEYSIIEGMDLDDSLYNKILEEKLYTRAKKRGMNLLKTMDRTESDVRRKLCDSGYPVEAVDVAIDYLKSYHYIDDMRYARNYIHFKSNSMSRKQIANKLSEKGISRTIIELSFSEIEDTEETSERELIHKLMVKKVHCNFRDITYEEKQKLFAYLYNKGFKISDIEAVYSDNCLT